MHPSPWIMQDAFSSGAQLMAEGCSGESDAVVSKVLRINSVLTFVEN